jgi:hypothetical protein
MTAPRPPLPACQGPPAAGLLLLRAVAAGRVPKGAPSVALLRVVARRRGLLLLPCCAAHLVLLLLLRLLLQVQSSAPSLGSNGLEAPGWGCGVSWARHAGMLRDGACGMPSLLLSLLL